MINNLTFVVFTYNEAGRIGNVIRNFQSYGRILVVDNFSTDDTVAIAREGGCQVLMNKNAGWVEDYETTEKVKAVVQTPWIYWAFADEIVSKDVLVELKKAIEGDNADIVSIMRKNYFYGSFCHEIAASYQIKAFKKQSIDFQHNTIHNFGKVTVPADRIYKMPPSKFTHHLISNTAASYLATINRYTDMEIVTQVAPRKPKSIAYYFLSPMLILVRDFLLRGGFKSGKPGISLSVFMLIYRLVDDMKRYEVLQQIDPASIALEYKRVSDRLLRDFH